MLLSNTLKVVALSVLVATSVHAKESEDMYFGLGAVQTKFGGDEGTVRGITTFNCVFILLPLYYYIIFKKTSR
jgi:hypothetical protein